MISKLLCRRKHIDQCHQATELWFRYRNFDLVLSCLFSTPKPRLKKSKKAISKVCINAVLLPKHGDKNHREQKQPFLTSLLLDFSLRRLRDTTNFYSPRYLSPEYIYKPAIRRSFFSSRSVSFFALSQSHVCDYVARYLLRRDCNSHKLSSEQLNE